MRDTEEKVKKREEKVTVVENRFEIVGAVLLLLFTFILLHSWS